MLEDALDPILDGRPLRLEPGDDRVGAAGGARLGEVGAQVEVALHQGVGGGAVLVTAAERRAQVAEPVAEDGAELEVEQAEAVPRDGVIGDFVEALRRGLRAHAGVHRDRAQPDYRQRGDGQRAQHQRRHPDPPARRGPSPPLSGHLAHISHTFTLMDRRAPAENARGGR